MKPSPENEQQVRARLLNALSYACVITVACYLSYVAATRALSLHSWNSASTVQLGGMWAAVATIFVVRPSVTLSRQAVLSRASATFASVCLSVAYLLPFPPTAFGLAVVVGAGALWLTLLGRKDDVITAGITTAVIFVVAIMEHGPRPWSIPLFRLVDTSIGVLVGFVAAQYTRLLPSFRAGIR